MQFLEDDEPVDCFTSGPQHSTPIKSRSCKRIHGDVADRNIPVPDCSLGHGTARLVREKAACIHHKDRVNSTSVVIMKHESNEASGHSPLHNDLKRRTSVSKCDGKHCHGLNICNNSVCTAVFHDRMMGSSTPTFCEEQLPYPKLATHIEQDIVSKQRREIHLLMEELTLRDQELNDLVNSHQSQVLAWEKDRDKLKKMQEHLKTYEADLRKRDFQLKSAVDEMKRVSDQKKDNILKLNKTEEEMSRLTQQIKENSILIKEMEHQNKTLVDTVKKLVCEKDKLEKRQRDLISTIESKDHEMKIKATQVEQVSKLFEAAEGKVLDLEEEIANLNTETHAWKQKYCLTKDDNDRMIVQIERKDEANQRLTSQLQESLQQAIALQKALFSSNEREKHSEALVQSLRKQQNRTMQELTNVRELYERQSKDMPLMYLSVKDNKLEEMQRDGQTDTAREREKKDKNMSYHLDKPSFLQHEVRDRSSTFLVKTKVDAAKDSKMDDIQSAIRVDGFESPRDRVSDDNSQLRGFEAKGVDGKDKNNGNFDRARWMKETEEKGEESKREVIEDGLSHTVGTSTSDLRLVRKKQAKPRSKSMSRISDVLSSPHSSYLSGDSKQQSVSVNECLNTHSERTNNRSRSISPLPAHEQTSSSAKMTTMTSIPFDSQHTDDLAKNPKPSRSDGTPSRRYKKGVPKGSRCYSVRRSPKQRNVKNHLSVYDSSSDISNTSSQEKPNCLDELTPADSDGMCHELQRDLSRVSLDDLHPSYKVSSSKESSYLPPHHRHMPVSKSSTFPSSFIKTSEWLNKCNASRTEDEVPQHSETVKTKGYRNVLKERDHKRHSPEGKHRRDLSPPSNTFTSTPRDRTQNYHDKSREKDDDVSEILEQTPENTSMSDKIRKSSYSTYSECDSASSQNDCKASLKSNSTYCKTPRSERKSAQSSSTQTFATYSSKLKGNHNTSNRVLRSSKESLGSLEKSSGDDTHAVDIRQKMGTKSCRVFPEVESSIRTNSRLASEAGTREKSAGHDMRDATDTENYMLSHSEYEKTQNSHVSANTSCNKSVRIQLPCYMENANRFYSEEHDQKKGESQYYLKSALKTQPKRKFEERRCQSSEDISTIENEGQSFHRNRLEEYESDRRSDFLVENEERPSHPGKDSKRDERVDVKGAVVREYYYKEKVSSGSENSTGCELKERHRDIPVPSFSRPFTSTRAPSLYKELSFVHFAEQTNRYELINPEQLRRLKENGRFASCEKESDESGPMNSLRENLHQESTPVKRHTYLNVDTCNNNSNDKNDSNDDNNSNDKNNTDSDDKNNSNSNDDDDNNNDNCESFLSNPKSQKADKPQHFIDSMNLEDQSVAGMEKFHAHYANIVKKLEFSSDSLLESSVVVSFTESRTVKPFQSTAHSASPAESYIRHHSDSQDSGFKTTAGSSEGGQIPVPAMTDVIPDASLNDLNQGASSTPRKVVDVSEAVGMTESDSNASSEAVNNETYIMSLPDYFPDISSVVADSDDDNDDGCCVKSGKLHEDAIIRERVLVSDTKIDSLPSPSNDDSVDDGGEGLENITKTPHSSSSKTMEGLVLFESNTNNNNRHNLSMSHSHDNVVMVKTDGELPKEKRVETEKNFETLPPSDDKDINCKDTSFSMSDHASNCGSTTTTPTKESFEKQNTTEKRCMKHPFHVRESKLDAQLSAGDIPQTLFITHFCDQEKSISTKNGFEKSSTSPLLTTRPVFQIDRNNHQCKDETYKSISPNDTIEEESADKFTDRLSTFLDESSMEELKEETPISAPLSPASKLHRLLIESQEMIRCFEKRNTKT